MKVAAQILYFDCEQFILRTIENCAGFVDKIYILYSPEPWTAYNEEARKQYKNPSSLEILKTSRYYSKIEVLAGVWATEEDQRNHCLVKARNEGFDFMIVQDADEFFCEEDYEINIRALRENPNYSYYRTPWYVFWKNLDNVIVNVYPWNAKNNSFVKPYKETLLGFSACFAINCRKNVKFSDKRMPNAGDYLMLDGLCLHLSYVLSDDQLQRKLSTWGHSHQVKIKRWLNTKWYGYNGRTKNFHPINHIQWPRLELYKGDLPKELVGFKVQGQKSVMPHVGNLIESRLFEVKMKCIWFCNDLKYLIRVFLKNVIKR